MKDYDKELARLKRALQRKGFNSVIANRIHDSDGDFFLQFEDSRKAIGTYDELLSFVEEATSVELLMAMCDLEDQLSD